MARYSNLLFFATILASTSNASWRMRCAVFPGAHRLDPIDAPGIAAKHAHLIHGGLNFGMSTTYDDLRASSCSSCQVPEDKSAYWYVITKAALSCLLAQTLILSLQGSIAPFPSQRWHL